jgi:hypothetical protein
MIIGDHRKRDKPHWADYALATAYETLEAEKCYKCGVPIWWAYSENSEIDFEHEHIDCEACAWDEAAKKSVKREKPGRTTVVRAIPVEGSEKLPDRVDFQEEMLTRALKKREKKK